MTHTIDFIFYGILQYSLNSSYCRRYWVISEGDGLVILKLLDFPSGSMCIFTPKLLNRPILLNVNTLYWNHYIQFLLASIKFNTASIWVNFSSVSFKHRLKEFSQTFDVSSSQFSIPVFQ
ncbi:hypothetical protein Thermo_00298 [Thermoplasmatales archaeon]|nr:hypothetical protein Thermo_00298 [Thermoplasmatales archaeon]